MSHHSPTPSKIPSSSSPQSSQCLICKDPECSGCAVSERSKTINLYQKGRKNTPIPSNSNTNHDSLRKPNPELPFLPGYQITEEIGRGGMGIVYKAKQTGLNRWVALKMNRSEHLDCPESRARFLAEAEVVACLKHPNIIQIYEIGDSEGVPYFSGEYVEGGNLHEFLNGKPQTPKVAAAFVETLALAVHAAHENNVLHRDLKPSNILLQPKVNPQHSDGEDSTLKSEDGNHKDLLSYLPKIADFGVAKLLGRDQGYTKTGEIIGTPSYMAPEQATETKGANQPTIDIYSLGAILYTLLTGRPPFIAPNAIDIVRLKLEREPLSPRRLQPEVPRDLETICLKCLQQSPQQRYSSALALAQDLNCFQQGRPISARPIGPLQQFCRWAKRNKVLTGFLFLVTVLFISGAVAYGRQVQVAERLRNDTVVRIQLLMQQADRFEDQAKGQTTDFSGWEKALSCVKEAEVLLENHPTLTAQKQQVDFFRLRIQKGQKRAQAALEKDRKKQAEQRKLQRIQNQLEKLLMNYTSLGTPREKQSKIFKKIIVTFHELGLNVLTDSPVDLGERIHRHPLRNLLYRTLASFTMESEEAKRRQVLTVLLHSEKDKRLHPVLEFLRDQDYLAFCQWVQKNNGTQNDIRNLMALNPAPPEGFCVLVGEVLFRNGAQQDAIDVILIRQKRSPDSLWLNVTLGSFFGTSAPSQPARAVAYLRTALALDPDNTTIMNNLGCALSGMWEFEDALYYFGQAVNKQPTNPILYCNRGVCLVKNRQFTKGIADLKHAIALDPDYRHAHRCLGIAYFENANYLQAENQFNIYLNNSKGSDPHIINLARQCRVFQILEQKLPAAVSGEYRPPTAPEYMALSQICYRKSWFKSAYTLSQQAFKNFPFLKEDRRGSWHRYNAACYACLATMPATQDPQPISPNEKNKLLKQALIWLEADLTSWRTQLQRSGKAGSLAVLNAMYEWKADEALAAIRNPKNYRDYPPRLRTRCQKLWSSVEELLRKARQANSG